MNQESVIQLFSDWNDALATGDPDVVTNMYATDAVLLPTVSNKVRHNHEEIRDYFVAFLAKQPQGVITEQTHGYSPIHLQLTRVYMSLRLATDQRDGAF